MATNAPAYGFQVDRLSYGSRERRPFRSVLMEMVEHSGFALISDVPATPGTVLEFARLMGSLDLEIDEELSGPPVMHLRYDQAKATRFERPGYFSCNDFPLHTDLSYAPNPPRFLLTMCIQPDEQGGGVSLLSDCREAWAALYPADRVKLSTLVFSFANAPNTGDGLCAARGLHEFTDGYEMWRYRSDTLEYPPELSDSVDRFDSLLNAGRFHIRMRRGDLLIIDNHRMVHGRTAFNVPSRRHLLRAYAQDPAFLGR